MRTGRLAAALILAAPVNAQGVGKVPTQPVGPAVALPERPEGPFRRNICINASRIAGAAVVDHRTVDLTMRGGRRWRLLLTDCPQLTFYGGFYYRQSQAGLICAGRDQVIGREGGQCQVRAIAPLRRGR